MKTKSFSIKLPKVKTRGHMPPPSRSHRDRKSDYNRRSFKNSRNW